MSSGTVSSTKPRSAEVVGLGFVGRRLAMERRPGPAVPVLPAHDVCSMGLSAAGRELAGHLRERLRLDLVLRRRWRAARRAAACAPGLANASSCENTTPRPAAAARRTGRTARSGPPRRRRPTPGREAGMSSAKVSSRGTFVASTTCLLLEPSERHDDGVRLVGLQRRAARLARAALVCCPWSRSRDSEPSTPCSADAGGVRDARTKRRGRAAGPRRRRPDRGAPDRGVRAGDLGAAAASLSTSGRTPPGSAGSVSSSRPRTQNASMPSTVVISVSAQSASSR